MLRLLSTLLVFLAFLGACERKPSAQPIQRPGPRLVSISPAVGVMLTDLHYDHLCVGRDGHDIALPPSIPVVGSQNQIDYEALIGVRPTHVFTQWGSRDLPARLVELAGANKWRLIDSRLLSLEDIRATMTQIDQEVCAANGARAPSEVCGQLLARMDGAWAPRGKDGKGYAAIGRVLLLAAVGPPAAFGPGSCHYQLIERLGATPAITSGAAYINLDAEDLLRLAPDAIILISPRSPNTPAPSPGEAGALRDSKFAAIAALDIPAAKNHRLALIDDPLGFIPSTSMIRVAEEVAEVLDRWEKGP